MNEFQVFLMITGWTLAALGWTIALTAQSKAQYRITIINKAIRYCHRHNDKDWATCTLAILLDCGFQHADLAVVKNCYYMGPEGLTKRIRSPSMGIPRVTPIPDENLREEEKNGDS